MLDAYADGEGREQDGQGHERVQLAILKLCEGRLEGLKVAIQEATEDWRDVLAYAEYPGEAGHDWATLQSMPAEEVRRIREADRRQYEDWLVSD